jgi:hypothetical protein
MVKRYALNIDIRSILIRLLASGLGYNLKYLLATRLEIYVRRMSGCHITTFKKIEALDEEA